MKDINNIVDNIFDVFGLAKSFLWKLLSTPFNWWFNLPEYVHWITMGIIVIIGIIIGLLAWKYRDNWRYLYIE